MPDCEEIPVPEMSLLQSVQQENEELRAQLEKSEFSRKSLNLQMAELEEKCQELSAELAATKESERWLRREHGMLAAQMEIVCLIFGGRHGGGCGGCH